MALTTVVVDSFLSKLLTVLRELEKELTGPLTLAMLVPSSISEGYRSLVLSSPRLDAIGLSEATSAVLTRLNKRLGNDAEKIDTVSILRTKNPAVRAIGELYDIPELGTAYKALGMPILSFGLDDPILFVSKALPVAA